MRDVELRAWVKEEKKMYAVVTITWRKLNRGLGSQGYGNIGLGDIKLNQRLDYVSIEDIELQQYTGLKDKNGKKIFEGDIVRSGGKCPLNEVVIFADGKFIFGTSKDDDLCDWNEDGKVIGNVFENPELNKEAEK